MFQVKNTIQSSQSPVISIIIVVYNSVSSLEKSIFSVITQAYKYIELIIIDGGSSDGTVDVLKKYDDKITYWISEPDKGIYDAMNKGVDKSTGDWIYFLGSGDLLLDSLAKIVPKLVDHNTIYYGDVFRLDTQNKYAGKFSAYKLAVTNICHQAILYPESVFKRHKYKLQYRIQADHILNMDCFGDKQFKFHYIPFVVAIYEGDGYSANNIDLKYVEDKLYVVKVNFPLNVFLYAFIRRKLSLFIKKLI